MSQNTTLRRAYDQPGFIANRPVRVAEDDATVFIVPLRRRRKKTPAEVVAGSFMGFTTTSFAKAGISIAAAAGFSSNSSSDGSAVLGAV